MGAREGASPRLRAEVTYPPQPQEAAEGGEHRWPPRHGAHPTLTSERGAQPDRTLGVRAAHRSRVGSCGCKYRHRCKRVCALVRETNL
eukprot:6213453-Pleurochrysis_carterae.AAC.6